MVVFNNSTESSNVVSSGNIQFRKDASNSSVCFLKKPESRSETETLEFRIQADQTVYNVLVC